MSAVTTTHAPAHAEHEHGLPPAQQVRANRLGLWLFCFSEMFLFGALLASRFVLWGNTRPELSQVMGLVATSVLLLSSFFMYRAEMGAAYGDRSKFLNGALLAAALGTLFFIMVVVLEWNVFGLEGNLFGVELFGHLTEVNSQHHQAVSDTGSLTATAWSPDGVVEAIEGENCFGVQWHPELIYTENPAHLKPFEWLVRK